MTHNNVDMKFILFLQYINNKNECQNSQIVNENIVSMVKPLINEKQTSKTLPYKPSAIIMGRTGAGKTTLVNMLCAQVDQSDCRILLDPIESYRIL